MMHIPLMIISLKNKKYFSSNPNSAVLAFNEIRGIFVNDNDKIKSRFQ